MHGPALPGWRWVTAVPWGGRGGRKFLGSFQSDHTGEHSMPGSIPGWGASCSTMNAGYEHHRVTVVSRGSTEPYAIHSVPTDAGPCPTSPGFGRLEEALASSGGC